MRRWMLGLLLCSFALWIDTAQVAAQPRPNAVSEWVETADGMKLNAQFTPTTKPKHGSTVASSPVVLLLYPPGVDRDMNKGNWGDLIDKLNAEGFHVFQFDWRGHGKSTDIVNPKDFWQHSYFATWNMKYVKGANKKPVKVVLKAEDVDPKYSPAFVQDLAAVRMHLDQKNDKNALNASSIYVIGAEGASQLGMLWLTSEWLRPSVHPMLPGGAMYQMVPSRNIANKPEGGKDIAGMIWLSATQPTSGTLTSQQLQMWVKNTPSIQESNPMLFLFGEMDKPAKTEANYYFNQVLIQGAKPPLPVALQLSFVREIAATKLRGVGLLGMNAQLKTEDTILDYLKALEKARGNPNVRNRNYVTPYFINLSAFGINP